ncbi:Myocyte-specific enhancer factor 2d [Ceratocystis lukuohia]|uniref:Myocyte-specific enhancer factor 2d n=1 Tax=Ceratocystis lukuohia TaxID=2019550 RepID=A0ABR4MRL5_9PEZI
MSAPNLPGYFYDAEKKRYFKIEKSSNATSSAKWTTSAIRKREEEEETAAEVQRKRLRGAWLAREFGPDLGECSMTGAGWNQRQRAARNLSDAVGRIWASSIRVMGRLQFNPSPHLITKTKENMLYANMFFDGRVVQDFSLVEAPRQYHSHDIWTTYSLKAGPRNSEIAASIGGSRGVLQLTNSGQLIELYGPHPRSCSPEEAGKYPRNVFAHDFLHESPNVTVAGGGTGNLWTLDTRVKDIVNVFSHGAGVTNLSVIGNHQVLVAGLKSRMCIYDLRYTRDSAAPANTTIHNNASSPRANSVAAESRRSHSIASAATPHTVFPGYINNARLGMGFAVSTELGVVCTATDGGKVVLHSLGSGRQLKVPILDGVDGGGAPIVSMRFAELPDGTRHPSLYMGVGSSIYKFSSLGEEDVEMLAEREIELERRRRIEVE